MASYSHDHDHGETESVIDRTHHNSWSTNLNKPQYEEDLSLLKQHAIEAVEHTASGYHVTLVTHEAHGHPGGYLYKVLNEQFGDEDVRWKYIDHIDCGCCGHVIRVYVE